MIVDERIVDYIRSLETRNSEILEMIEQEALKERVPIIRKEMQSFLKVLLLLKKTKADSGDRGCCRLFGAVDERVCWKRVQD